jgi:wobble nucleotide-excising tRNase
MGILVDIPKNPLAPPFRKLNLIYGFNGSGKSTLSRIFSCLQTGSIHQKLPSGSSFSVKLDDGTTLSSSSGLNGIESNVAVFNSDFIEDNIQWSEARANPVFYIGANQAQAAKQLKALDARRIQLKFQAESLTETAKQSDSSFGRYKRERAKKVAAKLHLGSRRYEAPHLMRDYDSWQNSSINCLSDGELAAEEELRRQENPLPKALLLELNTTNLQSALSTVKLICEKTIGEFSLDELRDHPDMAVWLNEGCRFHKSHSPEKCIMCGSVMPVGRLEALGTALNHQVESFLESIRDLQNKMRRTSDAVSASLTSLPHPQEVSPIVRPHFERELPRMHDLARWIENYLKKLEGKLREKYSAPGTNIKFDSLPSQIELNDKIREISVTQRRLNKALEKHNSEIEDFEATKDRAETRIRQHYIAVLRDELAEQIALHGAAIKRSEYANRDLEAATLEVNDLQQKIREHGPAANIINNLVHAYLGHTELSIHAVSDGFELRRHARRIEGTPSEGEKMAIAIAYFLSSLESDGRKLSDLVVVIDDPVSSLDSRALNYACSLIRSHLSTVSQLFLLTHNQQCMNEFKKAWRRKAFPGKDKEPTASFYFIDVTLPKDGDKRTSSLIELPSLLCNYESEYQFLVSRLIKFREEKSEYSEYGYMMPNVLRRTLEIFLAFKCPGKTSLGDQLRDICESYEGLDENRIRALERLAQLESHSDNLDDLISFSSMTLEETKSATETLFYLMDEVDEKHAKSIYKACE